MVTQDARKIKAVFNPTDSPARSVLPSLPTLAQQGGRVSLHVPSPDDGKDKGGGLRGKVFGRSRASRRRLMDSFAVMDWTQYQGALFVGLSFPDPMPSMKQRRRMLNNLRKWLERRYADLVALWSIEYGERTGRFHYHLMILQTEAIPIAELQAEWTRLGGGVPDDSDNSVDIEFVPAERVARYLSKYCSKAGGSARSVENDKDDKGGPGARDGGTAPADPGPPLGLSTAHICPQETEWTGRTWGWWNGSHRKLAQNRPVADENIETRFKVRRVLANWLDSARRRAELRMRSIYLPSLGEVRDSVAEWGGKPGDYRVVMLSRPHTCIETVLYGEQVLAAVGQYTAEQRKIARQLVKVRPWKKAYNHIRKTGRGGWSLYVPDGVNLTDIVSLFVEQVDADGCIITQQRGTLKQ